MINGVLTERTVSDVLPALQTNADGLKKVLEDLVKQYQSKQSEMEKWKVCMLRLIRVRLECIELTMLLCRRRTIFKLCSNNMRRLQMCRQRD